MRFLRSALFVCAILVVCCVAQEPDKKEGAGEKETAGVNYLGVYLLVEGKGSSSAVSEFVEKIKNESRIGVAAREKKQGLFFELIEDDDEADQKKLGLFCQMRVETVRTVKKKVDLEKAGWYSEQVTQVAMIKYQVEISDKGKWKKLGRGKVRFNESSSTYEQTQWVVFSSAFDIRIKKAKTVGEDVELQAQIRNKLPLDAVDVAVLAPFTVELPRISPKPYLAVKKIAAGGKEKFSVTVPHYLEKTIHTSKGDGELKTYLIWKDAFVAGVGNLQEPADVKDK